MNKLFDLIRNEWVKARLTAPPLVQRALIQPMHEAKEIFRLLTRPYLPVYHLQGQGQAGPLTVTYAGLDFAKPYLVNLLFSEKPAEKLVGHTPWWRYPQLADAGSSDLVIVETASHLIRRLPRQNALIIPPYVHHILDVRGTWEDVRSRFSKKTRRNKLSLIRKYNYQYQISRDKQDFETFYHQMYLPTMNSRHGDLNSAMSKAEAYEYFRFGWLFKIMREGEWVSGVISHLQQKLLISDILGVKNADEQLIREGATLATYFAAIEWANEHRYNAVNFLGSVPYLASGLFYHKRSWGTTISIPAHLHRRIWLRVRRVTPAIAEFLKRNPLVIEDDRGHLHGLITVDHLSDMTPEIRQEWEENYAVPGLSSLLIRSVSDFAQEPEQVKPPSLIIPVAPVQM